MDAHRSRRPRADEEAAAIARPSRRCGRSRRSPAADRTADPTSGSSAGGGGASRSRCAPDPRNTRWASRDRPPPSCTSRTAGSRGTASSVSPAPGSRPRWPTLDHTRPTIGAQAVGIAQGALDASIAYTKERKQFGKSIADFQSTQFMLADMAMKIEAARLMVYTAAARAERHGAQPCSSWPRPRSVSPPMWRWR